MDKLKRDFSRGCIVSTPDWFFICDGLHVWVLNTESGIFLASRLKTSLSRNGLRWINKSHMFERPRSKRKEIAGFATDRRSGKPPVGAAMSLWEQSRVCFRFKPLIFVVQLSLSVSPILMLGIYPFWVSKTIVSEIIKTAPAIGEYFDEHTSVRPSIFLDNCIVLCPSS